MKKTIISLSIMLSFLMITPSTTWTKYFTDPNTPLDQSYTSSEKDRQEDRKYQQDKQQTQNKEKSKKKKNRKKKYSEAQARKTAQFGLKVGWNFPTLEDQDGVEQFNDGDRVCIDMNAELIINPFKHIGIGIGGGVTLDMYTDSIDNAHILYFIPVYGIIKLYLFEASSPYLVFNVGYNVSSFYEIVPYDSTLGTYETDSSTGGMHWGIGGGWLFSNGFQLEVLYSVTEGGVSLSNSITGSLGDFTYKHSRVTLSLGIYF